MASDFSIRHAAKIIRQGGVLAYPTDTIYGLGCDPLNRGAVERINLIKNRPLSKHFILLAGSIEQLEPLLDIDDRQKKTIQQTTKPTSWIVKASRNTPAWLTDSEHQLTVRISQHPLVQRLCLLLGHAIISTSANPSGRHPAKNSIQIHQYFHSSVDKILASHKKLVARPSTIIRLRDNCIIRE
jgi:L-threonylcarbamoyladenylate synthase